MTISIQRRIPDKPTAAKRWSICRLVGSLIAFPVAAQVLLFFKVHGYTTSTGAEQKEAVARSVEFCSVDSFLDGSWQLLSNEADHVPLYRNLSCPFENLQHACDQSSQTEKASRWARTSFIPHINCQKKSFEMLFNHDRDHEHTILFLGDSLARQTFVAFTCGLISDSTGAELVSHRVDWLPTKEWCNGVNWCFDNPRKDNMYNGYNRAEGIFRYGNHTLQVRFIDVLLLNSPIFNLTALLGEMSPTKKTTVMVSDGARPGYRRNLKKIVGIHDIFKNNPKISFAYQEMTAAHFPTPDGSFKRGWNSSLGCVDTADVALAFAFHDKRITEKIMNAAGIPILRVWNATQKAGPSAHIGLGKDCVHFCNPGVPNMFAEQFTHFLLEERNHEQVQLNISYPL